MTEKDKYIPLFSRATGEALTAPNSNTLACNKNFDRGAILVYLYFSTEVGSKKLK
jgi:hypothetical protein